MQSVKGHEIADKGHSPPTQFRGRELRTQECVMRFDLSDVWLRLVELSQTLPSGLAFTSQDAHFILVTLAEL